jgi:hypothetical protein
MIRLFILSFLLPVTAFGAAERRLDASTVVFKSTSSGSTVATASGSRSLYNLSADGYFYVKDASGNLYRVADSSQKNILLKDTTGAYTYDIQTATPSGNISWVLPPNNGAAPDYFLKNNGSGLLTWASASGSSGSGGSMIAFWNGYHTDDCRFSSGTTGAWLTMKDTTCTFSDSGPESTGFPAVSVISTFTEEEPGIEFTTTIAGVYEVCVQYELDTTAASYLSARLYDVTNGVAASPVTARFGDANNHSRPMNHCGMFTYASGVTFSVRVEVYNDAAGTASIGYSIGSTVPATRTMNWSVKVYEQ